METTVWMEETAIKGFGMWWPSDYIPTPDHVSELIGYAASMESEERSVREWYDILLGQCCGLLTLAAQAVVGHRPAQDELRRRQSELTRPGEPEFDPTEGLFARMWHMGPDNPIEIKGGFITPEKFRGALGGAIWNLIHRP